jgi:hypothetical protein
MIRVAGEKNNARDMNLCPLRTGNFKKFIHIGENMREKDV